MPTCLGREPADLPDLGSIFVDRRWIVVAIFA